MRIVLVIYIPERIIYVQPFPYRENNINVHYTYKLGCNFYDGDGNPRNKDCWLGVGSCSLEEKDQM